MLDETSYQPEIAVGEELEYAAAVDVSGQLTERQLAKFARNRRHQTMGPTTIYYAGLTAPAVTAGMSVVAHGAFSQHLSAPYTLLAPTLVAVLAGLSWYLIFMNLAGRKKNGRQGETEQNTRIYIDDSGVEVLRGEVRTLIGWKAVKDVTISRHHIALIIEGANDVLLPKEWFGDAAAMERSANRILALRPPPVAT